MIFMNILPSWFALRTIRPYRVYYDRHPWFCRGQRERQKLNVMRWEHMGHIKNVSTYAFRSL